MPDPMNQSQTEDDAYRSDRLSALLSPLNLAGTLVIAAAALIVYFPSFRGPFLLDDGIYLTESRLIKASDGLYRFWFTTEALDYYPVSNTSLWIEWRLWGTNAAGYRITNLDAHIATGVLVWLILHKLSVPGAFFAGLLFAVHPLNVESVAWISQRKDMRALFFALLSILFYLHQDDQNRSSDAQRTPRNLALVLAQPHRLCDGNAQQRFRRNSAVCDFVDRLVASWTRHHARRWKNAAIFWRCHGVGMGY